MLAGRTVERIVNSNFEVENNPHSPKERSFCFKYKCLVCAKTWVMDGVDLVLTPQMDVKAARTWGGLTLGQTETGLWGTCWGFQKGFRSVR